MSLSRKQRDTLMEHVYRTLRDYQDGKITYNQSTIGQLDQRLTAVFDRIRAQIPMNRGKKR